MRAKVILFSLILPIWVVSTPITAQDVGASGQPIPRFISIDTDEANMRTGPNRKYPIKWVYQRNMLPVKVLDENGPWRLVEDHEGVTGWMHRSLLSGRRTAIIIGGLQTLRSEPALSAPPNAHAEEGVVVKVKSCPADTANWCKVEHDNPSVTGWIPRAALYGVFADEIID